MLPVPAASSVCFTAPADNGKESLKLEAEQVQQILIQSFSQLHLLSWYSHSKQNTI